MHNVHSRMCMMLISREHVAVCLSPLHSIRSRCHLLGVFFMLYVYKLFFHVLLWYLSKWYDQCLTDGHNTPPVCGEQEGKHRQVDNTLAAYELLACV